MTDHTNVDDFMALIGEAETNVTQYDAPFDMKSQTNKVVFLKCRAKNFRSIGNEFMELDFTRSKTTLIVSEDNGSGKSTMAVWAPYYALFDKPYNPKDKKGALVNSSTKKDMMVELEFNVRGRTYMVRRGYKPSVFEILFQLEDGSWHLEESPAAMKDQQAFLEDTIGFDAKIAENVMILGSDKFTPFIEMSAPERRHVVETVWDLAVFPVMLKISKEDLAQFERSLSEGSMEIDRLTNESNHLEELIQSTKSKEEFVRTLQDRRVSLESELKTLSDEFDKLGVWFKGAKTEHHNVISASQIQLAEVDSEVTSEFSGRHRQASEAFQELQRSSQKQLIDVESSFTSELCGLNLELEGMAQAESSELSQIINTSAKQYQTLAAQLENAKGEAERIENEIRAERGSFTVSAEDTQHLYDINESIKVIDADIASADTEIQRVSSEQQSHKEELAQIGREIDKVKGTINFLNTKRGELETQISSLEHLGTCPTCKQNVGEDAIKAFTSSIQDKLDECDTTQLEQDVLNLVDREDCFKGTIADCAVQISRLQAKKMELGQSKSTKISDSVGVQNLIQSKKSLFDSETESQVAVAKSNVVSNAQNKITQLVNDTKVAKGECSLKWSRLKEPVVAKITNVESRCQAAVSQKQAELQEQLSDARNAIIIVESECKAELAKRSTGINAEIESRKSILMDLDRQFELRKSDIQTSAEKYTNDLNSTLEQIRTTTKEINGKVEELTSTKDFIGKALVSLQENHQKTAKDIEHCKIIINELGDKAAKADIIKAYMPFLNHKINEYLGALNLHVGFKMDENFEVEFTSPDRKGQTTFSLSKGQMMRMNLSVLFALRDVANLKASISTNLLILDETIEPLSAQGVREIMEMIEHKFKGVNIFVVTQRTNEFEEHFKSVVRYGLRGGFTEVL